MPTQFLFLDESNNPTTTTGLFALTGLLVPVERYVDIRESYFAILARAVAPDDLLHYPQSDLHGNKLLNWLPKVDDDLRCHVLDEVVDLIIDSGIFVIRLAYFQDREMRRLSQLAKNQRFLWSLCWFGISQMIQPVLENDLVIPVMDGLDEQVARVFSETVLLCDRSRASGREGILSIAHSKNLGQVLYAKSQYSVFTQMADLVGSLRNIADRVALGKELTPYQERLAPIATKLDPAMIREERIAINQSELQGGQGNSNDKDPDWPV